MSETIDKVITGVAFVAGVSATPLVWLPRKQKDPSKEGGNKFLKALVFCEVVFEFAIVVLLGFSLVTFASDTDGARKRLKASIIMHYIATGISVFGLVASLVLSIKRKLTDPSVTSFSRGVSQIAWVVFLVVSIGAFVAAFTVRDENARIGDPAVLVTVVVPFLITLIILGGHAMMAFINCFRSKLSMREKLSWKKTSAFHLLTHKILTSIVAVFLFLVPFVYTVTENGEEDGTASRDVVNLFVELLAVMLHRLNLKHYELENMDNIQSFDRHIEAQRRETEFSQGGAASGTQPQAAGATQLPTPAGSDASFPHRPGAAQGQQQLNPAHPQLQVNPAHPQSQGPYQQQPHQPQTGYQPRAAYQPQPAYQPTHQPPHQPGHNPAQHGTHQPVHQDPRQRVAQHGIGSAAPGHAHGQPGHGVPHNPQQPAHAHAGHPHHQPHAGHPHHQPHAGHPHHHPHARVETHPNTPGGHQPHDPVSRVAAHGFPPAYPGGGHPNHPQPPR